MCISLQRPLQTSDGVAVAGKDYIAQKGSLVFEDGETKKEIKVAIVTDCARTASMVIVCESRH